MLARASRPYTTPPALPLGACVVYRGTGPIIDLPFTSGGADVALPDASAVSAALAAGLRNVWPGRRRVNGTGV